MKYTIFKNADVAKEDFTFEKQNVIVSGDKIVYVGKDLPFVGETIDCSSKILMPAFYNAHTHLAMSPLRGYGENSSLQDWLFNKIFPYEAELKKHSLFYPTQLCLAEMIRFGCVSASDMYFRLNDVFDAVEQSGAKANICDGLVSFDNKDYKSCPEYAELSPLLDRVKSSDGRVLLDLGIHAEYTNNEYTLKAAAEEANRLGLRIQIHVSETQKEVNQCKEAHGGKTPVEFLDECGVFSVPVTAAHCVWTEEKDLDIFAKRGVSAACCPKSNLKLASGISNSLFMKNKGVNVCLGTDSVSSNNNLNMLEEIRTMALLQKVKNMDPVALSPNDVLRFATRNGALSQGRTDCGLIKEGFKADIILLEKEPWVTPCHDLASDVVYAMSGSNVSLTMCDGKILYQDGVFTTIDVDKAAFEVSKINERVLDALK